MFCIAILYIHIKQMIKPFIRRKRNVYIPLHYELLKRKKIIIGFEEFFVSFSIVIPLFDSVGSER